MLETRHYSIHSQPLRVESEDQGLLQAVETLLDGFFRVAPPPSLGVGEGAFVLRGRTVEHAGKLPDIEEQPYPKAFSATPEGGVPMRLLVRPTGQRVGLLEDVAVTRYDLRQRTAEAVVVRGKWGIWGFQSLIPLLSELLAGSGMYLLHTGANVLPGGRHGVMFFGASGAGKTTSVLALAGRGWPLICDDAGFLSKTDGCFQLWGLPRASKVHEKTFELLPELHHLPSRKLPNSDEWRVRFRDLPGADPRLRYPIRALFLLQPRSAGAHRVQPLSGLAVLPRLLQGNLRVIEPLAEGPGGAMFHALAELCKSTPCFSLSVGPDLADLPEVIQSVLESEVLA